MENNNKEESREFYVYKHIRKDNNTCFYVGKGKGRRIYVPKRNKHHDRIAKRYSYYVVKVKENLTEKEAFALEREIIEDYVFVFGYGINIKGYRDYSDKKYLTNCTWGGEGTSGLNAYENKTPEEMEIICKKKSNSMKGKMAGENHPLYGKHHSEDTKMKMSEKNSGKKNPMFGKNAYANKTPEEMEEIGKKKSNSLKGKMAGEKSPMWGKPSHNRSKVICITTCKIFDCIKDAEKYYSCSNISACCREKYKYAGKLQDDTKLQWKYVKDYNNDCKGILINPIMNK